MAAVKRIKTIFQFRRDTTEVWKLNKDVVPEAGEPCYDLDLGILKIGDGVTTYENLKVVGGGTLSDDGLALIVEDLQGDVGALQGLVGKTPVADQIADAMTDVAKASDLTELENQVNEDMTGMQTAIEQKADASVVTDLAAVVDTKADESKVSELEEAVEAKADASTVAELATTVETKANKETITTLETELKNYVTEQIQFVEVGNVDDGEV